MGTLYDSNFGPIIKDTGINLVSNPRDYVKDAIERCRTEDDTSNLLAYGHQSSIFHKLTKVQNLLLNKKEETKVPFKYNPCKAYISNTYMDFSKIERDAKAYLKQEKTKVLEYLNSLESYLSKAVGSRLGENPESREALFDSLDEEINKLEDKVTGLNNKISPIMVKLGELDNSKIKLLDDCINYEQEFNTITNKENALLLELQEIYNKTKELGNQIQIIRTSMIPVEDILDNEGNGLLKDIQEAIVNQAQFIKESIVEIVNIEQVENDNSFRDIRHKQLRYGNAGFWCIDMPQRFKDKDILLAGTEQNLKYRCIQKQFFSKKRRYIEANPEVFLEEIYIKQKPNIIALVIFKRYNNNPEGYMYMSSENSSYINSLVNTKEIEWKKEDNTELYFFPNIPIKQQFKNIVEENTSYDEILRYSHITGNGLLKSIDELNTKVSITSTRDTSIRNYIKDRYDVFNSNTNRHYRNHSATKILLSYPQNKIKIGSNENLLSEFISDVSYIPGIAIDNTDNGSAKYLYKFFSDLIPKSKINKKTFETYISHQYDLNYPYLDCYNLENRISIRNLLDETLIIYNYIEEESFGGNWNPANPLYSNFLPIGYCETQLVQKENSSNFDYVYNIWDSPTLVSKDNNSEYYSVSALVQYNQSILEIYYKDSIDTYKKLSIHGLKTVSKSRYLYPEKFTIHPDYAYGVYEEDSYKLHRIDSAIHTINKYSNSSTNIASVFNSGNLLEPKNDISNTSFIIPMWFHDVEDKNLYNKDSKYVFNDANNALQQIFNIVLYAQLKEEQYYLFNGANDVYVPIELRDKVLQSYLDSFISKYNNQEVINRWYYGFDSEDVEKEDRTNLLRDIGIEPNILANLFPQPDFSELNQAVKHQSILSKVQSSKQHYNKQTHHLEELGSINKITRNLGYKDDPFNIQTKIFK